MTQTIILLVVCIVNIILWIVLFFHFKKLFSPNNLLQNVRREVEKLLIEIDRTADKDISVIEKRSKDLRDLIDKADSQIILAQKVQKEKLREKKVFNEIRKTYSTLENDEAVKVDIDFDSYKIPMELQGKKNKDPEQPQLFEQAIQPFEHANQPIQAFEQSQQYSSNTEQPVKEKVLELYRAGYSSDLISQSLDISVREIELIISMFG